MKVLFTLLMLFTNVYGGFFDKPDCVININGEFSTYNNELDKVYNKLNKINKGTDRLISLETEYATMSTYNCNYSNFFKYGNYIMGMGRIPGYNEWKQSNIFLIHIKDSNHNYITKTLTFQRETATEVTCQNKC